MDQGGAASAPAGLTEGQIEICNVHLGKRNYALKRDHDGTWFVGTIGPPVQRNPFEPIDWRRARRLQGLPEV